MDAYTYKCPGCGSSLSYDAKTMLLVCDNCLQFFKPDEMASQAPADNFLNNNAFNAFQNEVVTNEIVTNEAFSNEVFSNDDELMEINIYQCSNCGSELMTQDTEVSGFCSYCGQPSIIFDRISKEKKPQRIIPFVITKEQALAKAKEKFAKAKYLADTLDNIKTDSVVGIYMPYWVYDTEMEIQATVNVTNNKRKYTYDRREHLARDLFLDGLAKFNDYASKQLNPFHFENSTEFNVAYLSGFYADRTDIVANARDNDAHDYMEEILLEIIANTTPGAPPKEIREHYGELYERTGTFRINKIREMFNIKNRIYMLCPVYFITFTVATQTVILLVNGSTGKVVGTLPYDEKKVAKRQKTDMIVHGIIWGIAGALLFRFLPILWSVMFLGILTFSIYVSGSKAKQKYEELYRNINSSSMFDLSKNRK